MTTIAWDGVHLVADRQAETQGMCTPMTKIWRENAIDLPHVEGPECLIAITGNLAHAMYLKRWFLAGADPDVFRHLTKDEEFARLIVIDDGGKRVRNYEHAPDPILHDEGPMAWGSGVDIARCALLLGQNAWQAVETAHKLDPHTGADRDILHFNFEARP